MASQSIGGISVTISANTNKFRTGLDKARKHLTRFRKSITDTLFSVRGLAGALAGGMFAGMIRQQMQVIDQLAKTADKIGITTQSLQGLRHAAELSGVASNTLDMALMKMSMRLSEAARGGGEATGILKELGLDAQFMATLSPDQQMRLLADALQKVSSQSDRARIASKLFEEEGVALVNMLKGGSAGLDEMTGELEKFGGAITRESAAKVEQANDAITRLQASIGLLIVDLTANLAPIIETVANKLREWAQSSVSVGGTVADVIHTLKLAFLGLRSVVTGVIAYIVQKFDQLAQVIIRTVNKIPGVTASSDNFTAAMNATMQQAAKTTQADFNAALIAKTPSEQMRAALGSGAGGQAAAPLPQNNKGVTSALGGIADRLKMRASRFAMETGFKAKMLGAGAGMLGQASLFGLNQQQQGIMPARLNNASIGAVDANSAAGFAQRTRAMRNDPQMRLQKDQLAELRKIANNTKGEGGLPAAFA